VIKIEYILDEKGYKKSNRAKDIKYIINNECWECISHFQKKHGYMQISRNKKFQYMHRYVHEIYNGKIAKGLDVMHLCDNPKCINPSHLKTGTHKDNMNDMFNKNRRDNNKISNSKKKLNEKQLFEIKKLLLEGKTLEEIASLFNITHPTVGSIKRGISTYSNFLGGGYKEWIEGK
jgi:hypothetical protein